MQRHWMPSPLSSADRCGQRKLPWWPSRPSGARGCGDWGCGDWDETGKRRIRWDPGCAPCDRTSRIPLAHAKATPRALPSGVAFAWASGRHHPLSASGADGPHRLSVACGAAQRARAPGRRATRAPPAQGARTHAPSRARRAAGAAPLSVCPPPLPIGVGEREFPPPSMPRPQSAHRQKASAPPG